MPMGAQDPIVRPWRIFITCFNPNSSSSFFVIVLILVASFYLSGADDRNESQPLLKFKSSLETSNPNLHHRLATWNPSKPPCSRNRANWSGVICFNGYVWGLQLENMNLKGEIDVDTLVPLHSLRALSLTGNNFEGPMPDWRKLGALKSLYLSNNHFSGQIPEDAFKGMTSLKKVHLSNNNFTGHIPASLESPKLIELRLDNNHFTGPIPLISSEHLNLFNVSNNQLEGPIPAPLSKMDPTSFSGNIALCGEPLELACPSANKTNNNARKIAVIIIYLLVVLFLLIIVLVVVNRRRRRSQTPKLGRAVSSVDLDVEASSNVAAVSDHDRDHNHNHNNKKRKSQRQQKAISTSAAPGKLSFVREDIHMFELPDLMRASAEVLGSGNFGASYKAVLVDGRALVVKRFKQMNTIPKEDFFEHMRRLGRLKHRNLLPLVAYLYRKEEKLLVFDYTDNGSLAAHLHGGRNGLTWAARLKIIKGVGEGLVYLQRELPSMTLPHGHLKSSNVLLDKDFNPLLMDYALSPVVNSGHVHQVLLAYKSPEYAKHGLISKKTEVWCLGVLILETLTGKYVAHGPEVDLIGYVNAIVGDEVVSSNVFDKDIEVSSESCRSQMEKLLQIAKACCQEDPEKRWDLEETIRQIEQVQESSD